MVEAVLFDLFETLVTESEARPSGASSLGSRLGFDPALFRTEWKRRRHAITIGHLTFVDALAEICVALESPVGTATLEELRRERLLVKARSLVNVDERVIRLLDQLAQQGKRVGVVSNCFAEDVASWSRCDLASRVRHCAFSFEVGCAKPDPAIYLYATDRLRVRPEFTLFVGDGANNELTGAAAAGMRAYRAAWFLVRWNGAAKADDRSGTLQEPEDVLRVAV